MRRRLELDCWIEQGYIEVGRSGCRDDKDAGIKCCAVEVPRKRPSSPLPRVFAAFAKTVQENPVSQQALKSFRLIIKCWE